MAASKQQQTVLILLCALLGGCGLPDAPPMKIAIACSQFGLDVQLEEEVPITSTLALTCLERTAVLSVYLKEYEARFGPQAMRGPIRLRAARDLGDGVGGKTYTDAIDIALDQESSLPHELNHWRQGAGHGGWCADFAPWSKNVMGFNQDSYLGCP